MSNTKMSGEGSLSIKMRENPWAAGPQSGLR